MCERVRVCECVCEREEGEYHLDVILITVVMPAVVVRQRKPYRRKDGTTLYFEGTSSSSECAMIDILLSTHR